MENRVLFQFAGFLNTRQIWKENNFPYQPYLLKQVPISKLPRTLEFSPSMVLGKRMELFFQYYVTHFSHEEVLAHNEQVIFEKKTLGELDFILKNSVSGEISHVELVYKFYLYVPEIPGDQKCWIGPNQRDSFPEKLTRLQNNQFPLLYRKETLPLLDRLKIDPLEVTQKLCFKANLFLPKNWGEKTIFSEVNPDAVSGYWIKASAFTKEDYGNALFYSPKKPDWPIEPKHNEVWESFEEILPKISELLSREQSPLVWMKKGIDSFERIFIVWW